MERLGPYLVTGKGISVVCHSRASVLEWCDMIVRAGGFPDVSYYTGTGR